MGDISVVVISEDPYFLFAARGLLGRSREIRIHSMWASLDNFTRNAHGAHPAPQAVVCDLDSISYAPGFFEHLRTYIESMPQTHYLCLAGGNLAIVTEKIKSIPIRALLAKNDLGYCLHLAIRAVVTQKDILITESIKPFLRQPSFWPLSGKTIAPPKDHPALTTRLAEIMMWRVFIGLDNADIQDELLLQDNTVRDYVSRAYKALGVSGELDAFEVLSEWWWLTRFSEIG